MTYYKQWRKGNYSPFSLQFPTKVEYPKSFFNPIKLTFKIDKKLNLEDKANELFLCVINLLGALECPDMRSFTLNDVRYMVDIIYNKYFNLQIDNIIPDQKEFCDRTINKFNLLYQVECS